MRHGNSQKEGKREILMLKNEWSRVNHSFLKMAVLPKRSLSGLNAFLRLYKNEPNFNLDQLIRKLQRNSAVSILSKASGYMDMRSKNDRIAKALVFTYNEKRKEESRLPYNFKM